MRDSRKLNGMSRVKKKIKVVTMGLILNSHSQQAYIFFRPLYGRDLCSLAHSELRNTLPCS